MLFRMTSEENFSASFPFNLTVLLPFALPFDIKPPLKYIHSCGCVVTKCGKASLFPSRELIHVALKTKKSKERKKERMTFHQPQREAALSWCDHANCLTSPATPELHTDTYMAVLSTEPKAGNAPSEKAHQQQDLTAFLI